MYNKQDDCAKTDCEDLGKMKCIPFEQRIIVNDLARAYVPFQKFCNLLEPCDAFLAGTVFPELNKPEPYLKKGEC